MPAEWVIPGTWLKPQFLPCQGSGPLNPWCLQVGDSSRSSTSQSVESVEEAVDVQQEEQQKCINDDDALPWS